MNTEKLEAKRDVAGLVKALGHRKAEVRRQAALGLGRIEADEAIEPLLARLQDGNEDFQVRAAAAEAMGSIGNPETVVPILAGFNEQDPPDRERLHFLLDSTDWGPWAVEPLLATLQDTSENVSVRTAAAKFLGRTGDAQAVPTLVAALGGGSALNAAASKALVQIGDPAVEQLRAALEDEDWRMQEWAAAVLSEMPRKEPPPRTEPVQRPSGEACPACRHRGQSTELVIVGYVHHRPKLECPECGHIAVVVG